MKGLVVAMWSGPRNISTAMMRAFENREDCQVLDEPFYAHYLSETGVDHPGRAAVLASQATDWRAVVALVTRDPGAGRICYQKQMTHHITADVDLAWLSSVRNAFLLREPGEVVRSYSQIRDAATLRDVGFEQQARIFDRVCDLTGEIPPVIDARDVLADPRRTLDLLCERLQIPFSERMLSWPAGPRASDGIWAPHWYRSVWETTGFGKPKAQAPQLDEAQRQLADLCRPYYERLAQHCLR